MKSVARECQNRSDLTKQHFRCHTRDGRAPEEHSEGRAAQPPQVPRAFRAREEEPGHGVLGLDANRPLALFAASSCSHFELILVFVSTPVVIDLFITSQRKWGLGRGKPIETAALAQDRR